MNKQCRYSYQRRSNIIAIIYAVLHELGRITDEELSSAKARIKANNIYKFDSVFYQAMQVGMLETKDMSWKLLDDYYKISESISLDEIKSAGKTYITGNEPLVTILRPKK